MWNFQKAMRRVLRIPEPLIAHPHAEEVSVAGAGGLGLSRSKLDRLGLRKCVACGEFFDKSSGWTCNDCLSGRND